MRSKRLVSLVIFAMLGSLMFALKLTMEALPNIHLLGAFIAALTAHYRFKALIPIYIYVFLDGLFHGFDFWWIPYLYIWTVLWALIMLVPKKWPLGVRTLIYIILSALHGLLFGTLYAPFQAIVFGLSFEQMLAWIASGLAFDVLHLVGNVASGFLILPMIKGLKLAEKAINR